MLLDFHKARALVLAACALFILFAFFLTNNALHPRPSHTRFASQSSFYSSAAPQRWRTLTDVWTGTRDPTRIMLASVLYDDPEPNELLERALLTHEKHAERWGYATRVLRKRLVDGWWGKWGWLQTLVTEELNKDDGEGAEWIMFLSPTAVLSDPSIPLSLFLPPTSLTLNSTTVPLAPSIHFLAAYDPSSPLTSNPNYPALTPSAFLLHIHPWTLALLHRLLAAPLLTPPIADEALALAKSLSDTLLLNPSDPFPPVVLVPERWFAWSASSAPPSSDEEDVYHLRAATHFPPNPDQGGGTRWKCLHDAVSAVEKGRVDRAYPFGFFTSPSTTPSRSWFRPAPETVTPFQDTAAVPETTRFWTAIAGARALLTEAVEVRDSWSGGGGAGDEEGPAPQRVEGDEGWVAVVEGMAEVAGGVAWGSGRMGVLEGAERDLRRAMGVEGTRRASTGGAGGRGPVGREGWEDF